MKALESYWGNPNLGIQDSGKKTAERGNDNFFKPLSLGEFVNFWCEARGWKSSRWPWLVGKETSRPSVTPLWSEIFKNQVCTATTVRIWRSKLLGRREKQRSKPNTLVVSVWNTC